MCIALIGGMDRLKRNYEDKAAAYGVNIKVLSVWTRGLADRLKNVDAILVFTGKTSHKIRDEAMRIAKTKNIPVMMMHSCGVSSLRTCIEGFVPKMLDDNRITG